MKSKSAVRVLRRMRQLLSRKNGWAKFALATTKGGVECKVSDPLAKSFCLSGAYRRAVSDVGDRGRKPAYEALRRSVYTASGFHSRSITDFNDCSDRPEVLNTIDDAIARVS